MSSSSNIHQTRKEKKKTIDRLSCLFFREKEKKYLFLHIKTTHLSLSASHIIEERLYLSFTKKKLKKKKKIQRSLLMLDARVKLRQKAQLAELCSRWVGTKCITFFLFFPFVACEKSTRFRYTFFMMRCARFVRFCSAM